MSFSTRSFLCIGKVPCFAATSTSFSNSLRKRKLS
ncbi:hypothetical protein AALP_AAs46504U000100 [Arabis alpina]|uniref:Uncharacterized protein n=1 Tax=Arabis alpina TaxID=50452 RepID=A0A087G0U0_ARAAL|nr:hypothetical protein AALP_AAs46504U000100 [Arabis alpina]